MSHTPSPTDTNPELRSQIAFGILLGSIASLLFAAILYFNDYGLYALILFFIGGMLLFTLFIYNSLLQKEKEAEQEKKKKRR